MHVCWGIGLDGCDSPLTGVQFGGFKSIKDVLWFVGIKSLILAAFLQGSGASKKFCMDSNQIPNHLTQFLAMAATVVLFTMIYLACLPFALRTCTLTQRTNPPGGMGCLVVKPACWWHSWNNYAWHAPSNAPQEGKNSLCHHLVQSIRPPLAFGI
jgi:hypothetical protein